MRSVLYSNWMGSRMTICSSTIFASTPSSQGSSAMASMSMGSTGGSVWVTMTAGTRGGGAGGGRTQVAAKKARNSEVP